MTNDNSSKNQINKAVETIRQAANEISKINQSSPSKPVPINDREFRQDSHPEFPSRERETVKNNSTDFPSKPVLERKSQSESLRVGLETIMKK